MRFTFCNINPGGIMPRKVRTEIVLLYCYRL